MSRRATIIGTATDYKGNVHDVRESRPTVHGFDILIGWPVGRRGRGTQGPGVILTHPLVDLLIQHAHQPANPVLPVSGSTLKKIRKALGINRYTSIADWWARQGVPGTLADVAAVLGRSASAVSQQERSAGVRRIRPAGWWRLEPARSMLLNGPPADAAKQYGLTPASVRRLRMALRNESA